MSQSRVGESSSSFNNNYNSFNNVYNVNNFGNSDERTEVLAWLSPLEPRIRHDDIAAHRVEDVGDWLLRTVAYQNWFHSIRDGEPDNSALFCCGAPGVGKTYISSLVIDRLGDWARGKDVAVACFYFDFAAQKEQSPTSILRSILKQVVHGLREIPAKIAEAFRDQEKVIGGRKLRLGEIVEMLQDITSSRPTFICIDALDECMAEYRPKLLDSLKQVLHKSPGTRLFLAGRLHIQVEVEKHLGRRVAAVSVTPTKDDIIRFLRAKLDEDPTPDEMDNSLQEDIITKIPETVSEIFLLVSLNIQAILQETTLHRRREKLTEMTKGPGLGDAYDATIGRIKAQGADRARLGMAALMWISHSERPLHVDEICHALAVDIGSTGIHAGNAPSIRTVLLCCQGLAAVDQGASTIRLIHFTLKEYLSHRANMFDRAHATIAETCLTYLNLQAIKDLSASPPRDLRGTPLLGYSSLYWGTHMRMELSDRSRDLALRLLHQYDNHISAELLWESAGNWNFGCSKQFSALHCISYFGIAEVAIDLIRTKIWDVNQRDSAGLTPLMWAARYGREEVVELLLQQEDTQPDIPDTEYGRTALSWAAARGREGVVRLLLGPLFANPRSIGHRWGKTLRASSALFGRKYVNPDRPDNCGRTPLSWAAKKGHIGVVKLLLGREDVNPDRPDNRGKTPLSWAALNRRDAIVKLLLEREDVNPDRLDNRGETLLSWAAQDGDGELVKLLLGRKEVNSDRLDNSGETLLSWAARDGNEELVKLLLGREDVTPDIPDSYGLTPLAWAARSAHDGIMKLLLGREDVNPDRPDNRGETLLSWAAQNGDDELAKLMLGRADVSPDNQDENGRTPLSWASEKGHDGIVKLLLRREDLSSDKLDNGNRTPLLWAAKNGHYGVAMLLLGRGNISPDSPDNYGRTPLSWAAGEGHDAVVKALLGLEDVDPDRPDRRGQTPLSWAAEKGHDEVVKLLLAREDVTPDRPDKRGKTPLSWAASNRHGGIVKLLNARKAAISSMV